jgi:hypothetical protein
MVKYMKKEQILNTSDDAATFVTDIKGWVDRHGRYFGDSEKMARWSGCTHITCECGNITEKNYTICSECREKNAIIRYNDKKKKQWDGKVPLYSDALNKYFMDEDDLRDFLEDHPDVTNVSLRLLICEPVYLRHIESDYFCDELPDDDNPLPCGLEEAIEEFNGRLDGIGVASWTPGDYALKLL